MQNFKSFWSQSSYSYKFYVLSSITLFIVMLSYPAISLHFIDINAIIAFMSVNIPMLLNVITQYSLFDLYHFESLFVSFYGRMPVLESSINLLFQLLWLRMLITDKECGTLYTFLEVILINFQVHVVYGLLVFLLAYWPQLRSSFIDYFLAYGLGPILVVYEFRQARRNPEKEKRFCFLPFTVKAKYFAWFTALVFTVFTRQVVCILAATILGCVQELMVGQMIIKLPFCLYKGIEWCLPNFIKSRYDYVAISYLNEKQFKEKCLKLCPDKQNFGGAAVRIGGQETHRYNKHIEQKNQKNIQEVQTTQQIRNIKKIKYQTQKQDDIQSKDSNDQIISNRDRVYFDADEIENYK